MNENAIEIDELEKFQYYDGINILIKEILCEDILIVFNEREISLLQKYESFDYKVKKTYLRLLFRRKLIIKETDIRTVDFTDLKRILSILTNYEFLEEFSNFSIEEILKMMSKSNLDQLIKEFKINCNINKDMDFKKCAILKQINSSSLLTNFFNKNKPKSINPILKKCIELVGSCIKITELSRKCFDKLFCYISAKTDLDKFTTNGFETTSYIGQSILFALSRLKSKQLVLPIYEWKWLSLFSVQFKNIENFNEYVNINSKYLKIINSINKNAKIKCAKYYNEFLILLEKLLEFYNTSDIGKYYDLYHATIVRACYKLSDALETSGLYENSLTLLNLLISQKIYSNNKRGHWYERKSLIYEKRFKNNDKAVETISEAFNDSLILDFQKYSLAKRAIRILSKNISSDIYIQSKLFMTSINIPPSITIKGKRVTVETKKMTYSKFVTSSTSDALGFGGMPEINQTVLSGVENYALNYYYIEYGFTHGLFAEGAPYVTLFGLIFWDIIFSKSDQNFISPFQIQPLDFYSRSFSITRSESIEKRLKLIKFFSEEEIFCLLQSNWSSNKGCLSPCVNWELFKDVDAVFDFFKCLGPIIFEGICLRLLDNFPAFSSGLPDLVLWNPTTFTHLISEVKGPGDKLSDKQILWIHVLKNLGANVHVCYVKD